MLGKVADVVIDPARRCVTHLVVQPRHQVAVVGSRLVPVELVDSTEGQAEIALRCTLADVRELEPVEGLASFPGAYPVDDPNWDVGVSRVLSVPYYEQSGLDGPDYPADVEMTYDRIPKDAVEIRRSSLVVSADEHQLGRVGAFILDQEDMVTHFVLKRGHLWGRRDVTIPISAVTEIATDEVTLGLTKDQVAALPAARVRRS
ncbi:MAG TPA: hypothetical protein VN672_09155 [Solirubrobacteraceae bacterium]|nr:hypothetical protein [Solirubrobacteraceae bacterium]